MTFAFVYIAEAHASDEWPVGHAVHIKQPKSTKERVATAQQKLADLGMGEEFTCLVDLAEENNFHEAYACWPFRWYSVEPRTRRLMTIAQPRESGYDIRELVSWIVSQADL